MKHGIILVFASIIVLLFVSSGICRMQNLVYNGGFEKQQTDAIADGWHTKTFREARVELTIDHETTHSGSSAFKASFKKAGRAMLYPDRDITSIQPGKTYEVSLWVKARNLDYSPNFSTPNLRYNFGPTRIRPYPIIDFMTEMKGVKGWKKLSLTSKAPPDAEALSLNIMLTAGTIWLDDISITEVAAQ
ncbi:MAG: carbohydrate binding domain-containing protein [Thermodesulfobacteriota bacterium]